MSDITLNATLLAVKPFGQLLREIRTARHLSQKDVARRGAISHQRRLTDYEDEGRTPGLDMARKIAIGLGFTSLTELVALWEEIDLPQTDTGLKRIAISSLPPHQGLGDTSPREPGRMADRIIDPFEEQVVSSYRQLKRLGREVRDLFATQVSQLAAQLVLERTVSRKRKNQ